MDIEEDFDLKLSEMFSEDLVLSDVDELMRI